MLNKIIFIRIFLLFSPVINENVFFSKYKVLSEQNLTVGDWQIRLKLEQDYSLDIKREFWNQKNDYGTLNAEYEHRDMKPSSKFFSCLNTK